MELGTGIFLSAVFLGTVALYITTKDRWNWKKIIFWPVVALASVALVAGISTYLYEQYQNRPVLQESLWGVTLRSSPADVAFAKGKPAKIDEENAWVYPDTGENYSYYIRFKNNKVRAVIYLGSRLYAPTIAGVSAYSSVNELEDKLGPASFVSRSKDELLRWYSFEKFNVIALYGQGEIVAYGIYDATTGPIRFIDEAQQPN